MEAVRRDSRPLYVQVQEAIMSRILEGLFREGEQLPPEDQLATDLGVSRTTLRTALGNLETMGFIQRIHGAGTFVSKRPTVVEVQLDKLESFHPRLANKMGLPSKLTTLSIKEIEADAKISSEMNIEPGTLVTSVCRVVEINDMPIAYLCDYLPHEVVTPRELQMSFKDSVVDYFDGSDDRPLIQYASSVLSAVRAGTELSKMLVIKEGETLLHLEEGFYTGGMRLISWSTNFIIPEYFRFHIDRRVVH